MCLTVNTSISCLLFLSKLINAFDLHIEKFNRRLFVVIYEKNIDPNLFCTDLDHLRLSDSTAASDGCTVSRDMASHFWFVLAFFILHIKCIGAGEGREVGGGGESSRPMICWINSVLNHLGCLNFSLRKVGKIYVNKCYGCLLDPEKKVGDIHEHLSGFLEWVFFFCNFLSSYVSSTKSPKI